MCYVYIYLFTPVEHTQRLDALLHVRKKSKRSVDVVEVEVAVSPISLYLAALLRYLTYCWASKIIRRFGRRTKNDIYMRLRGR